MDRARATFLPALLTTALLLTSLAAGCAAKPAATPAPDAAASKGALAPAPPSFTVLARHALDARAPASVGAEDLVGRTGDSRTLAVVAGRAKGERRTQRVVALPDGGVAIEESTRAGLERTVLRRRDDGGYTLLSVDTPGEDSRSEFAPSGDGGLEFARPTLSAGEAAESASPMRVTLLSTGKRRATGSASRTQRIVGIAEIEVCGERLVATVVETLFIADLDSATARRESELFVAAGRGIVAERWREKVTVLGIFPKTTEETVVVVPTKATP